MHHVIRLAISLLALSQTSLALAGDVKLPDTLREGLRQNAQQIDAISVSTRSTSVLHVDEATLKSKFNLGEIWFVNFTQPRESQVIWQYGKMYSFTHAIEGVPPGESTQRYACDGRLTYALRESTIGQTSFEKMLARNYAAQHRGVLADSEYFPLANVQLPEFTRLLAGERCRSPILDLLNHGGKIRSIDEHAKFNDRNATRIEIEFDNPQYDVPLSKLDLDARREELARVIEDEEELNRACDAYANRSKLPRKLVYVFFVDPAMSFATVSWEKRYDDGTLMVRVTNDEFTHFPGTRVWLPRACVREQYVLDAAPLVKSGTPIVTTTIDVEEASVNQPADDPKFVLSCDDPTAIVIDETQSREARGNPVENDARIVANPAVLPTDRKWIARGLVIVALALLASVSAIVLRRIRRVPRR